jgi:hypothetical protein
MRYRRIWLFWHTLAVGITVAIAARAPAQSSRLWQRGEKGSGGIYSPVVGGAPQLPLNEMPAAVRDQVRAVLDHPTLSIRGQPETFNCNPELYRWFLDHPNRVAVAWRRLGAKVADIADRGNGQFGWSDAQGSDIRWNVVHRGPSLHVWHAEGKVRPGALLPLVPVQAVVVLRYTEAHDNDGQPVLRHQVELILHTDSKAMALATRLFGASAPRLAEQYVSQVEMFFSALAWYMGQHPDKAEKLLAE